MEQENMKILILTGNEYQHRYVVNHLCRCVPIEGVIVDEGIPSPGLSRFHRYIRRYGILRGLDQCAGRLLDLIMGYPEKYETAMLHILGRDHCLSFERPDLITYVNGINSDSSYSRIQEIAPDIIAVYGTAIVRDRILNLASSIAFNLHTGISPYYRGAGCSFWPIYNRELDYLGATVHECTSRVDGGKIYGIEKAALQMDDTLESIFPRCVVAGASLYAKVIREWLQNPTNDRGKPQDFSLGVEYRAFMRNWRKERIVRKLIRNGIIKAYLKKQKNAEMAIR
jgi:hypothetical protein